MWRRVCSLAVEGTGRGLRALDATAFARRRRGQLFQAGAQLLGQAQLIRSGGGTRGGGSSACSHGQLDSGHDFRVADAHAHPASLTAGMGHGEITFPLDTALAVAQGTGTLQAVATAFAAVEGHMVVRPGDAAGEAGAHVLAQLLNGQHVVHADLQGTAHQIWQRGRQTEIVMRQGTADVGDLGTVNTGDRHIGC